MMVWRQRTHTRILYGSADRKMVQTLIRIIREPAQFMHWIIEKAPYSCTPMPIGLCLEIQNLTNHPCFPE